MQPDDTSRHSYPTGQYGTPVSHPQQYGPQYSPAVDLDATFVRPAPVSPAPWLQAAPPTPPKRRRRTGMLVATAVVVLITLGILGAFAVAKAHTKLDRPADSTLRSACETAIRDEFNRRNAGNDSQYVVAVLSSIVVDQEVHRDNPQHFSINGSFTATAAAALVGSIPVNVLVSCEITTKGSNVVIVAVINR